MRYILFLIIFLSSCDYFKSKGSNQDALSKDPVEREIQLLTNRLLDSPKNSFLYYQRGQLYWQQKENEKALNDFYKMTTYDSTKPMYYEVLASFFVDNMNIERGIQALDYAIKLDPYSAKYHVLQGKYSLYIKRYQDAINHFNNALKRDVHSPDAYLYKGFVYKEMGNMDKAISNLTTATEQDPTWDAPYELLGQIYAEQKNDLCLKFFDNAAKANNKNSTALNQKAFYLKEIGKVKEAEEIYQNLVSQFPQNGDAIYNLGVINYDLKQYEKALKQLQICIQVEPSHALAYYLIGKTQLALGHKDLAKSAFQNAKNFDTTMKEAQIELNKL
jgi:tetratricopeptide (TPR) repeat protein